MIGSTEIIIIALVILVLFGASAIPKFARSIGKAKAELQKGMKEGMEEEEEGKNDKDKKEKTNSD